MTPTALILDFGEVLTKPQPPQLVERMASLARLPLDQFVTRYWRHRPDYDAGLPASEFWHRVLEDVKGLPDSVIADLIEVDAASWRDYRADVWNIAASFRALGNRTAILSNGVPEIMSRVRAERALESWFDAVLVSYEVGLCKPDPAIYRACLERVGVEAGQALFVDDRVENLRGAESVGLQTYHFTGDSSISGLKRILQI
jgi:putative hydrolase of the HAD superfamily